MEQLTKGQRVKHIKRKLHEARFEGFSKAGRAMVCHNIAYPHGVWMVIDYFKPENIIADK